MFSNIQLLWNTSQLFGYSSRPVELKFVALLNILGVGMRNTPSKTLDKDYEVPAEGISPKKVRTVFYPAINASQSRIHKV